MCGRTNGKLENEPKIYIFAASGQYRPNFAAHLVLNSAGRTIVVPVFLSLMLHAYNRIAALSQPGRRWLPVLALFSLMMSSLTGWAQSTTVVISQVYGAGGNAGATYQNDYVELFNKSASSVSLTGWSVQYASTSGSFAISATASSRVCPAAVTKWTMSLRLPIASHWFDTT